MYAHKIKKIRERERERKREKEKNLYSMLGLESHATRSSAGVSICTFVVVNQVN